MKSNICSEYLLDIGVSEREASIVSGKSHFLDVNGRQFDSIMKRFTMTKQATLVEAFYDNNSFRAQALRKVYVAFSDYLLTLVRRLRETGLVRDKP